MKFQKNDLRIKIHDSRIGEARAFTLVEMIVSLAIFSVVAVVAVGALVRVVSANRQAQSIQSSVNTISFALESLTREMRVGTNYSCTTALPTLPSSYPYNISSNSCYLQSNINGQVIAFNSSNVLFDASSKPCYLVYAYEFVLAPTKGPSGEDQYIVKKAQQASCGQLLGVNDFYPIISSSIHLTGYSVGVYKEGTSKYAWAFIRLTGYAGERIQDQSKFDVQTSVSQRVVGI